MSSRLLRLLGAVLLAAGGSGAIAPAATAAAPTRTCGGIVAGIVGTPGPDTIVGTGMRDIIWAGAGDDVIDGRGGDDILCGAGGNDTVRGNDGYDDLRGGTGNDLLEAGRGNGSISGDAGDDILHASNAIGDYLYGGTGDDQLYAHRDDGQNPCGSFPDPYCGALDGGPGDDLIDGGSGELMDQLRISGSTRPLHVDLARGLSRGQGTDTLVSIEALEVVDIDGPTDDHVRGTDGANVLDGGGGNDVIRAGDGDDWIRDQSFYRGDDRFFGEGGSDRIEGSEGSDLIAGGPGEDALSYQGNLDPPDLRGGPGDDELTATQLFSSDPATTFARFRGGSGADELVSPYFRTDLGGGRGPDNLYAGPLDDLLDGGAGPDFGSAGDGDDTCSGLEVYEQCELPPASTPAAGSEGR